MNEIHKLLDLIRKQIRETKEAVRTFNMKNASQDGLKAYRSWKLDKKV